MKKNKIILAIIVTIAVLLVAAAVVSALFLRNNDTERPLSATELLDLGEKYLLEMDYEKALVQFLKVLEIEPMNPRAYISAAKTYVALGQIDNAMIFLNRGLDYKASYKEIRQIIMDQISDGLSVVTHGLSSEQLEMLSELKAALTPEEYFSAANIVSGDTYKQVVKQARLYGLMGYYDSGAWLLVYPSGYAYCGDIKDNLRYGMGIWFDGNSSEQNYRYYKGQWVNDLPNGQGTIIRVIDERGIEKEEGHTYALYTESIGNFSDGYYDGVFSVKWNMDDGEVHSWTPTYARGVGQKKADSVVNEDGSYVIAICANCGARLISDGSPSDYVFGFGD